MEQMLLTQSNVFALSDEELEETDLVSHIIILIQEMQSL